MPKRRPAPSWSPSTILRLSEGSPCDSLFIRPSILYSNPLFQSSVPILCSVHNRGRTRTVLRFGTPRSSRQRLGVTQTKARAMAPDRSRSIQRQREPAEICRLSQRSELPASRLCLGTSAVDKVGLVIIGLSGFTKKSEAPVDPSNGSPPRARKNSQILGEIGGSFRVPSSDRRPFSTLSCVNTYTPSSLFRSHCRLLDSLDPEELVATSISTLPVSSMPSLSFPRRNRFRIRADYLAAFLQCPLSSRTRVQCPNGSSPSRVTNRIAFAPMISKMLFAVGGISPRRNHLGT
jgi:hypothetical protein